jgi:hypothetical protein
MRKKIKGLAEDFVIIILSVVIIIAFFCLMGGLLFGPALAAIASDNSNYAFLYLITGPIAGMVFAVLDSWRK